MQIIHRKNMTIRIFKNTFKRNTIEILFFKDEKQLIYKDYEGIVMTNIGGVIFSSFHNKYGKGNHYKLVLNGYVFEVYLDGSNYNWSGARSKINSIITLCKNYQQTNQHGIPN